MTSLIRGLAAQRSRTRALSSFINGIKHLPGEFG
jgi:hypothetical protein